jgi:hypothetical protein
MRRTIVEVVEEIGSLARKHPSSEVPQVSTKTHVEMSDESTRRKFGKKKKESC